MRYKQWFSVICLMLITSTMMAQRAPQFNILGVDEKEHTNIETRLNEFYQHKKPETSEELIEQVEQALYPYGYFNPHISIRSGNPMTIRINKGKPTYVKSISVKIVGEGAQNANILKAANTPPLKENDVLNSILYEQYKENLMNAAEHEGYLRNFFVKSDLLIDKANHSASIILVFNTGPQFYFGKIEFDPTYISKDLLARYVPFKYGHPYSTEDVLSLNNHLASSGYFQSVTVKPSIGDYPYVPIRIHLKPVPRYSYSLGAGYGTDTGPRGRAILHVIPVNQYGHKFNILAQGSFKENALQAQYIIPGQNPVTDKYSLSGGFSNLNYGNAKSNAILVSFAQQHAVKKYQRILSLNALNERFSYIGEPKREKAIVYPKGLWSWNNTANQLFSPTGYNMTLIGLGAARRVLSEVGFLEGSLDARGALTIDSLRTRFYGHAIMTRVSMNQIEELPVSLAPLLGGAENLRGYGYNSLGPGKKLYYAGMEIQKETYNKWYVLGFFDLGDVYDPDPKETKYDAGVGLMWVSPVGPIKLGIAQAVNKRFERVPNHDAKLIVRMGPDL